jgi:hypothetical protein
MADLENSKNSDAEAIPAKPKLLEGSLKGWLAVLACWCIMFNTFGYINAFGYADVQNENNVHANNPQGFTSHITKAPSYRIKAIQILLGLARYKFSSCFPGDWYLVL